MIPFDRFTEAGREMGQRTLGVIQRYERNLIDSEHVMLALIEQPNGVVPRILKDLNASPQNLADDLGAILKASSKVNVPNAKSDQIFITPRVKQMLDLSNEEAQRFKDKFITTEHVFLALLAERDTPVARLLETSGVTRSQVDKVIRRIRRGRHANNVQGVEALYAKKPHPKRNFSPFQFLKIDNASSYLWAISVIAVLFGIICLGISLLWANGL